MNSLQEKIDYIYSRLTSFSNFIELADFRSYLLFTLTSQVPNNILAQIGLSGSKGTIHLPYDPINEIYFQKINMITSGSIIVYTKHSALTEKFYLEKDDVIFKNYLSSNEISMGFQGKEKFVFPLVSDCSSSNNSEITIKVDDLYHSLESFISLTEPNVLFVLDAENDKDPDLIFAFNLMPEMPAAINQNTLKIDAFLDSDHKTREIQYLRKIKEDYKIKYLKDLDDLSHGDLYNSSFSLIIHIKSFNQP